MRFLVILSFTVLWLPGLSQRISQSEIQKLTEANFITSLLDLKNFLEIPNYGKNDADITKNIAWCDSTFKSLGFETQLIYSKGVPHVFAQKLSKKRRAKTILFYLQIDGQPVDSAKWDQLSPYLPVLKDCAGNNCVLQDWAELANWRQNWRIFGRSTSDSKGPALAFISALKIMQKEGLKAEYNIKVIMDFQEELGSPALPQMVSENLELFSADAMLIMDGTRHYSNLPTLTFGARGIATIKLTVFGANKDLHSGQYGNFAPNPAFDLAQLLAAMKHDDGKVLIPGFYDGVNLTDEYKEAINSTPEDKAALLSELGLARAEAVGETYQEALQFPSLNIRGLQAGWTGEQVRTIIPATAVAEIDMRLVTETPAERQIALVRDFIEFRGFYITDSVPTEYERGQFPKIIQFSSRIGSKPFKTKLNSTISYSLGEAMDRVFGNGRYIKMQATGGSQPIAPFISTMNIPAVSIRIPNPDNSIHAPNENLRLGNFEEGIRMCLGILTQDFK